MDALLAAHRLGHRAAQLRRDAGEMPRPLATAMFRRASELEFAAHILAEVTAPTTRVVRRIAS